MKRALVLVDGEHYLPVTKAAIEVLSEKYNISGVYFLGGTEKIGQIEDVERILNLPVVFGDRERNIHEALDRFMPDVAIDLSDEPVVDYEIRFRLACELISRDIEYLGPDFHFKPLNLVRILRKPSVGIIGTGKRVGKTAASAFIARRIKEIGLEPVVLTMGRGGPPEPEVITDINLTPQKLLEEAHSGKHAASDHWEDALVSRITTVGCRRCGGGLAGKVGYSNVLAGAEVVNNLDCSYVLVEGSGAAIPPVRADSYITVVGGLSPTWYFDRYFGPFRLKMADLIFVTMWEYSLISEEKREVIKSLLDEITDVPKVYTVFRPKPVESIDGERIFVASTASQNILDEIIIPHLENRWNCQVVGSSEHLSNRPLLLKDLRRDVEKATTVITELKGAAVDVVTEYALSHNKRVVYMDNQPELVEGDFSDLTSAIKHIINLADERFSNQV